MHRGYVKLWRKTSDNPIAQKPNYLAVWIYLLIHANHKDKDIIFNNKKMTVEKGTFIGSMRQIATHYRISISSVKSIIEYLKREQMIEHEPNAKFSLFKVKNWDDYQSLEHSNVHEPNASRTLAETTKNEEELIRTKKKEESRFAPPTPEEVNQHSQSMGYSVDGEAFVSYYESIGWKVGKNPMKSWKGAVATWHKRDNPAPKLTPSDRFKKLYVELHGCYPSHAHALHYMKELPYDIYNIQTEVYHPSEFWELTPAVEQALKDPNLFKCMEEKIYELKTQGNSTQVS